MLENWISKVAATFCCFSLVFSAAAADQAMPYCFHLDGNLYNEGTAEASSYKLTKTGSGADSFSTTAQYGGKSLQGGTSNSYILTAATPGDALVTNADGWTLSMWVNFNGGGTMWRDVAGFSIGNKYYQIQRTNNNTYNIYGGSGTLSKEIPGKTTSDWVNVVFVMAAGSDTSVKIYADGGEVGTYSATDSLAGTGTAGLTSVSIGNQVLKAINGDTFEYYGRAQSGLIDEVAVYNFAANDEQIGWLAANVPSEELYGPIVQPDKTAYYKSGYIGDHASTAADALKLTETSGGEALEYNRTYGNWTLIIDKNSPAGAQAWCSDTVKYNDRTMKLVKVIIQRDFTLKPGVAAALFDGVEFEVTKGAKLTLTKDSSRNMSLGAVTFSGAGTIDAATGVTFKKDVIVKGDVQVDLPTGTFVAQVGDGRFTTLAAALAAAGDDGLVEVLVNSLTGGSIPDSWRGTVRFSGELAAGFNLANYGNANSTVEFKGASGYLLHSGSFTGALKLTNDGETPAWRITNGYKDDNFVIGKLTGDGDLVDASTSNVQQFSFSDASTFGGSITTEGKRFVIGTATHGSSSQYTARIYIEKGHVARVASGKTFSGKWGMIVDGTVKGSGTLACPSGKTVIFGFAADGAPTIDLAEGALMVAEGCSVQFNKPLTLKNAEEGAVILRCASKPTNLETVQLKDGDGNVMPLAHLEYADGQVTLTGASKKLVEATTWTVTAEEMPLVPQGYTLDLSGYQALDIAPVTLPAGTTDDDARAFLAKLTVIPPTIRPKATLVVSGTSLALAYDPMTLYWAAWRGTFWEHIGQTDVNGNHGLMRDADGNLNIAHRPNDTVIFDKKHYWKNGAFAEQTDYWHYDENLYIKDEVVPGTSNEWDLKILEGVTLKMGLRGARATGQNVISELKIYVEKDSTLELGYWGNTHHYQGVIRDDVVFGGAGTIKFGADLGPSLRAEGNVLVKNTDEPATVPTMNLNGKELVLTGANSTIGVNLTGFGSIVAEKPGVHLTGDVAFGSTATIDASNAANMLTLDKSATFGSNLTVKLTASQVSSMPVQVLALGEGASVNMETPEVRVLVDGSPVAAFYELYQEDNGLYVRVKEGAKISYSASADDGYDFAGSLVTVTMNPAIADLPVTVVVKNAQGETVMRDGVGTWTGVMAVTAPVAESGDGTVSGSAVVMVGDEDHLLDAGNYTYVVTAGDQEFTGSFYVGNKWFAADPTVGAAGAVTGGSWTDAAPAVTAGKYQLTDTATFNVTAADKAAGEVGVVEQVVTFTSAADAETLAEAAEALADAKCAVTLAEDENGELCWKGYINGAWTVLTTTASAELGEHCIRLVYDRSGDNGTMKYYIDGAEASAAFAASGALTGISYVGSGTLASLEGVVTDPALVEYAEVKYKSMEAAVAAWKAAGKSGVITLLTNIFFAPEPGTYAIDKNGFKLYLTNDMIIEREEGTTIVVGYPPVVDRYTNGLTVTLDRETMDAPFIIDGEWLGKAIPWKRHSLIQEALVEKPTGSSFKRWQAYVLGFAADAVETAKAYVRAEQNAKPYKVTLDDGLKIKDARETGVVVTRKLVGSVTAPAREDTGGTMSAVETAYDDETGLPEFDLKTMGEKVQYLKISYEFSGDAGQK